MSVSSAPVSFSNPSYSPPSCTTVDQDDDKAELCAAFADEFALPADYVSTYPMPRIVDLSGRRFQNTRWQSASSTAARGCFRDGLHCIFAFLTIQETLYAAWTCHSWLSAAQNEPSKKSKYECPARRVLPQIARSFMRRHIATLDHSPACGLNLREDTPFWHALPSLTSVEFQISDGFLWTLYDCVSGNSSYLSRANVDTLPHTLRHLRLRAWSNMYFASAHILPCVAAAVNLTHLDLQLGARYHLEFAPLKKLTNLKKFIVFVQPLDTRYFEIWKELSSLETLDVNDGKLTEFMADLFREPHQLQSLTELNLKQTVLHGPMLSTASLPSLRTFEPGEIYLSALPDLYRLSGLREANLRVHGMSSFDSAPIPPLPSLERLILRQCAEHAYLSTFFPALVNVRWMHLDDVVLQSLEPLLSMTMLETLLLNLRLRKFDSWYSEYAKVDNMDHQVWILSSMPSLTSLTLQSFGQTIVRPELLQELYVPSARLTRLKEFVNDIIPHR